MIATFNEIERCNLAHILSSRQKYVTALTDTDNSEWQTLTDSSQPSSVQAYSDLAQLFEGAFEIVARFPGPDQR